jgi:hypothetical protein
MSDRKGRYVKPWIVPEPGVPVALEPGQRVLTPDGVEAEVLEIGENAVLVRLSPGEAMGWYPFGVLTPLALGGEPGPPEEVN